MPPQQEDLVRRKPSQRRSADTISEVLAAASRLLAHHPPEELTTTQIAAEAGLSVGALYRFFADKQAIFDHLAIGHIRAFEKLLPPIEVADGPSLLGQIIEVYVQYLEANPDFRAIALGRHVSAAARETAAAPDTGPTGMLKDLLVRRFGLEPDPELDLKLRVVSETGERLIAFAYAQRDKTTKRLVLREMKAMLAAYMFGSTQW